MRILILADREWVYASASGPDPKDLWRILAELGIEADDWPASALPLNPFGASTTTLRGLDPLRTVRVYFLQRRYELIICNLEGSAVGPALLKRLGLLRSKLVLADFTAGTQWWVKKLFQRFIFPGLDGIMCLSEAQVRIAETNPDTRGKAAFVGYDIDTDFFDPAFSYDGTYALALGKDVSRDYGTLLDAVCSLSMDLTICSKLKLDIPSNSMARITQVASYLTFHELRELYAGAKLVILPLKDMHHPGGITALAEAMSMGKPVICSNSRGIRDFLQDGKNAIVVPVGDRAALIAAIRYLDSDANERRRLGENARTYAEATFSIRVGARRMYQALKQIGVQQVVQ